MFVKFKKCETGQNPVKIISSLQMPLNHNDLLEFDFIPVNVFFEINMTYFKMMSNSYLSNSLKGETTTKYHFVMQRLYM